MAITYNPYGWKIIKNEEKEIKNQIRIRQSALIDLLNNLDDYGFYNHKSMDGILSDIFELQSEINNLWKELEDQGVFDIRPMYSESFRD